MGASSSSARIPGGFPESPTRPRHREGSDYNYNLTQTDFDELDRIDEQLDITPPSTQTTTLTGSSSPVKDPASDGLSDYSYASNDFPREELGYNISPPATPQFGSSQPMDKSSLPDRIEATSTSKTSSSSTAVPSVPPGDADIELSQEQKHVLGLVLQGKSVFFTGSAGTGKSVLLRKIIQTLREKRTSGVHVTASTGIAAANIQGETLHAFGGVGLGNQQREVLIARAKKSRGVAPRWRGARILIIDEISMVAARWFDDLEAISRSVRDNEAPFGGLQLVICGDFFQLPPVPNYHEAETGLSTDFAFRAKTWKQAVPIMVTLTQVFRQKQPQLIDMLNDMRVGRISQNTQHLFQSLSRPVVYPDGITPTEILPLRRQVEAANQSQLDRLAGKLITFTSTDQFFRDAEGKPIRPVYGKTLLDRFISYDIQLKVGAQVMCVKNIRNAGIVNGSVGKIVELKTPWEVRNGWFAPFIDEDPEDPIEPASPTSSGAEPTRERINPGHPTPVPVTDITLPHEPSTSNSAQPPTSQPTPTAPHRVNPAYYTTIASDLEPEPGNRDKHGSDGQFGYESTRWPLVEYTNGTRVLMGPMKFTHEGPDQEVQASRLQVPLILAWALTVHKSQGQTLDRVKVNLAGTFEKGQAYVAFSRCTSLAGLEVHNFRPHFVMAHPVVVNWSYSLSFYQPSGLSQLRPHQVASTSSTPRRSRQWLDGPDTDEEEIAIEMYRKL